MKRLLLLALLLTACDAPLVTPNSITVDAPPSCRGGGKNACPPPPPQPTAPTMDSIWIHPQVATLEVGQTMPYWMIGWFGGKPYGCADDGTKFVGRIALDPGWVGAAHFESWTLDILNPPDVAGDAVLIPDLSVCEIKVEITDPSVAEWIPRSFMSTVSAWLREIFA